MNVPCVSKQVAITDVPIWNNSCRCGGCVFYMRDWRRPDKKDIGGCAYHRLRAPLNLAGKGYACQFYRTRAALYDEG